MELDHLFLSFLLQDCGVKQCNPPCSLLDRVISCLDAVVLKRATLWASTCFPGGIIKSPQLNSPLCLISLVNNCFGFSSHPWYSNQSLLWAKQLHWPWGQLPGMFECVWIRACIAMACQHGGSTVWKTFDEKTHIYIHTQRHKHRHGCGLKIKKKHTSS